MGVSFFDRFLSCFAAAARRRPDLDDAAGDPWIYGDLVLETIAQRRHHAPNATRTRTLAIRGDLGMAGA